MGRAGYLVIFSLLCLGLLLNYQPAKGAAGVVGTSTYNAHLVAAQSQYSASRQAFKLYSTNRAVDENADLKLTYDQFMALNGAALPSETNPLATLHDITAAGYTSNYLFCEDTIFAGTTPVWRELEKQSDGGIIGSHAVTPATANTYIEMDRYVTQALNTTVVPSGTWKFTMYAKLNLVQKQGTLKVSINRVNSAGTIVSELGTAESGVFTNTVVNPITISKYLDLSAVTWNTGDRVGVIVSAKRGAEGSATITWYHDAASGWASIMETPITLLHNQMQGLNDGDYKHLTATDKITFNNVSTTYLKNTAFGAYTTHDRVVTTDPRLSNDRYPTAHEHAIIDGGEF